MPAAAMPRFWEFGPGASPYDSKYRHGFVYREGVETTIAIPELRNPADVHVDTAGNLHVVDSWNDRIVRVRPNGTQETIPPGNLAFPFGIFVDAAGAITVSNSEDRIGIVRLDAAGNQTTLPFTGLDRLMGLDIDSAGNIYVVQAGCRSSTPRVEDDARRGPIGGPVRSRRAAQPARHCGDR
ncbi:hypothetical protein [Nocardia sp. NPDC057030]|uniref:hypothetical protein n=1 Tax=unclassified Nocardia TaxID=2637762 RepID=UPI00362FD28C